MINESQIQISIREQVVAFLDRGVGSDHDAWELGNLFQAIARADSLTHRLDALLSLIDWALQGATGVQDRSRLLQAVEVLEALPQVRHGVRAAFADILSETEGVNLFGESGIPGGHGFIAELVGRAVARILPRPNDDHDLARLVSRLHASRTVATRLRQLPADVFHRIVLALVPNDGARIWQPLEVAFADGFRLLAVRVQAHGLASDVRERSHAVAVAQSPFFLLTLASHELMAAWRSGDDLTALMARWRGLCAACRLQSAEVERRLDSAGVNVGIVYALQAIEACLSRMEAMLGVLEAKPGPARSATVHHLLSGLIIATHQDRSICHLIGGNLHRLQRRIVTRSGRSGEHYVAHSRSEYRFIWFAAAGGGLLAVLTAAIELKVALSHLPLFVTGLLAGLNYAISFMLMHHLHLMLAARQPAMTAATLAAVLRNRNRTERLDHMVEFTVRICRSQLAAVTANVAVVFTGALLFNFIWRLVLGRNVLGSREAQQVFEILGPVTSGTVLYAALTGVILWLAALGGGWLDNWAVCHRLPQGIADHRLGERFGRRRMARFAEAFSRNVSAWGTDIALGLMLGFAPVIGQFIGLPIDVRHVTLSSGMLGFACAGLRGWFSTAWFFWAVAGVATMFLLNLGVSFFLSLYTALRACQLERTELAVLGARLLRRLVRRPLDFVLPRGMEKDRTQ
jgi:site-specific recombinase